MRSTDKFLLAIVAGVIVLVAVALVVATRQPPVTYRSGGTPEAAAFNYLLALQRSDYARALAGLSPELPGAPDDPRSLLADLGGNRYMFQMDENKVVFSPDPARVNGDTAVVLVHETRFYQGQLFNSGESYDTFEMRLAQIGGVWTIVSADRYWLPCWEQAAGCYNYPPKPLGG